MVDKIMCSKLCPCPESARELWEGYGDSFLRTYNRATGIDALSADEAQDYQNNGEMAAIVPLYFSDQEGNFETYERC